MRSTDETDALDVMNDAVGELVGTLDRFNDAKRAEERDRVKHNAVD